MSLRRLLRFDSLLEFFDTGAFRSARVKGLGKESTVYVVYPYGLTANAPVGALCVSWQVSGEESNRVAIADDPQNRPKDLKPGEVVVSNHLTGSEVRFSENGDISITTSTDANISAANVNVTTAGDVNITAAGDMALEATNIEITGSLTNNGTNIGNTHIHSQGADSDGDSEVDTGGPHS